MNPSSALPPHLTYIAHLTESFLQNQAFTERSDREDLISDLRPILELAGQLSDTYTSTFVTTYRGRETHKTDIGRLAIPVSLRAESI